MGFKDSLKFGRVGEVKVGRYLCGLGCEVFYLCDQPTSGDKVGPRIDSSSGLLVAPDLFTVPFSPKAQLLFGEEPFFAEVKIKSAFSWHHITKKWETGIDNYLYQQYLKVQAVHLWPVWIFFCIAGGRQEIARPVSKGFLVFA